MLPIAVVVQVKDAEVVLHKTMLHIFWMTLEGGPIVIYLLTRRGHLLDNGTHLQPVWIKVSGRLF
jgi:hypothetical protein